jgi:signal peptidase II
MRARVLLFSVLLLLCVGCDHATKRVATSLLGQTDAVSLVGDAVRFELAYNAGAFLSLGAGLSPELRRLLLVGLVPIGLAIVCVSMLRQHALDLASLVGVALIAGGGLGNWLDRLLNGGLVTDFVSIGAGPLRTGIFNAADVFLVAGVLLILAGSFRREPAPADDDAPP